MGRRARSSSESGQVQADYALVVAAIAVVFPTTLAQCDSDGWSPQFTREAACIEDVKSLTP